MFSALPTSRLFGSRIYLLVSPPKCTPQRFVNARFRRALHLSRPQLLHPIDYQEHLRNPRNPDIGEDYPSYETRKDDLPESLGHRDGNGGLPLHGPFPGDDSWIDGWIDGQNPDAEEDMVDSILRKIRRREYKEAYWLLGRIRGGVDMARLVHLPPLAFAEILRSLDPTRVHAEVDILDGLSIEHRMTQYGIGEGMLDQYGVREIYSSVFLSLLYATRHRMRRRIPTPSSAFTTLLRFAGASSQPDYAFKILELMKTARLARMNIDGDNIPSLLDEAVVLQDYTKTRLLTEPLYYQYDRTRVRRRPLLMHRMLNKRYYIPHAKLRKLHSINLSVRSNQVHQFRMDPHDIHHELQRRLMYKDIQKALPLSRWIGIQPTEEMICAALIASTRRGTVRKFWFMLKMFYGIRFAITSRTGAITVEPFGERPITPDSPLWPTERLLFTIMYALGADGELTLAIHLISFVSRYYGTPIPSAVWSEWFAWAAVHGAKPASNEWKVMEDTRRINGPKEAPALFEMLTSTGRFEPTIADLVHVSKFYIAEFRLDDAKQRLREAKALYRNLLLKHEAAVTEEVCAFSSGVPPRQPRASLRTETEVQHAMFTLSNACHFWLRTAANLLSASDTSRFMQLQSSEVQIPNFVAEFWDFMQQTVQYDTPSAEVSIINDDKYAGVSYENRQSLESVLTVRTQDGAQDGGQDGGPRQWRNKDIVIRHKRKVRVFNVRPRGAVVPGKFRVWDVMGNKVFIRQNKRSKEVGIM